MLTAVRRSPRGPARRSASAPRSPMSEVSGDNPNPLPQRGPLAVNPDLIERVEETPDTVITLTNGTKHVVQESIDEIIESVQFVKAATLALARRMIENPAESVPAHLRIVHDARDETAKSDARSSPTLRADRSILALFLPSCR